MVRHYPEIRIDLKIVYDFACCRIKPKLVPVLSDKVYEYESSKIPFLRGTSLFNLVVIRGVGEI